MAKGKTVPGAILKAGLTLLGKPKMAQTEGTLGVKGLQAPVEVLRDQYGIPHIYAQNDHDLMFAQGFVHAQDRFWQMELNRRTATGTLAELFGELALDTDRATRTFGFDRLGRKDWEVVSEEVRSLVRAYTDGVNACLELFPNKLPVEFTLLRHRPRPWQVEDTMAMSHFMEWQLSHAWYSEIVRAKLLEKLGEEHLADWDVFYPPENPVTLPEGIQFNRLEPTGRLTALKGPWLERNKGSNEWCIAPWRSATGAAILCNDMHLVPAIPLIWYTNHLVSNNFNVTGVTVPSLPLVQVGHNARIGWGMTLAFTDCEDLFVEKFDPQNPRRYEFQGEWLEAEVVEEAIPVKGRREPVVEKVILTRHGPVISDAVGQQGQRLAVQSMALQPCQALDGWLRLNLASGWDDFVEAMKLMQAPQLSVAYADTDGNIGWWATGRTPIRKKGGGAIPAPGWTGEYEWEGEIPFEEMPHGLNPASGYFVNCNNKIIGEDYPHHLGNAYMNGYRARRLEEMIESQASISLDDCAAMQLDVTCIPGQKLAGFLAGFASTEADVQLAAGMLRDWDGRMTIETPAGALYEAIRHRLVWNLLEPVLGKDLTVEYLGRSFNPVIYTDHEMQGNDTQALLRLLEAPDSWWFQQAGGKQALIERSVKEAVNSLREELGEEESGWQWGRLHTITFAHALGMQKPLDQVFNRGPHPVGGNCDTPWQAAYAPGEPFQNRLWAPSMRQILDMGDLTRCRFIMPVGQSGQLGSRHYDDLIEPYLNGGYIPMLWSRSQVEEALEARLDLQPG